MTRKLLFCALCLTFSLITSSSLTHGSPSSVPGASAPSGAAHRHRNKNWCAFIVQKNVSCAVQGSVESHVEPEAARCPEHQPDCEQRMMYRTMFRPTYKIAYKTVTELEWRCCPGYQGPDCREVKGSLNRQTLYPQSHLYGQSRPAQKTERRETGQHLIRRGGDKTHELQEEVQRLSQTVLDLQAAMTGIASNLRTDLQEDTSKMLIALLKERNVPDSARAGGTEESVVHLDGHQALRGHTKEEMEIETLLARLNDMSDALKSKDEALEELRGTVTGHDGQIRMLMDTSQNLPSAAIAPSDLDILQNYIDEKFEKLKKELIVNMETEMAKLNNGCDEKLHVLQKACEDRRESGFVSLTGLVHSKEAELRKEIRELQLDLSMSEGVVRTNRQTANDKEHSDIDDLRQDLDRVAEAHRVLNARIDNELEHLSTLKMEDVIGSRIEDLEDRMNVSERNAEAYCFYVDEKLSHKITDEAALLRRLIDEKLNSMQDQFTSMLIEMTNNSFPAVFSDSVDTLETRVTDNTFLLQKLEEKLHAVGQNCSNACRSSVPSDGQKPEDLDSLVKNVTHCRNDLNVLRTDFENTAARLHVLKDTVDKKSPEKHFINAHMQDTNKRLTVLTDNVNGLTEALTGIGDTVSKFSQDLRTLNSTCCRTHQLNVPSFKLESSNAKHNQIEELRNKLETLNARVTTELELCKLTTAGVSQGVSAVDDKVDALEKVCKRLSGETNNVPGFSEGLERQMARINATLGSHSREIAAQQNSLVNFQSQLAGIAKQILKDHASKERGLPVRQERPATVLDSHTSSQSFRPYIPHIHIPLNIPQRPVPVPTSRPHLRQHNYPQPPVSPRQSVHPSQPHQRPAQQPVVVTGQAGPPGYMNRVTVRRDQSSGDTKTPLKGFAGAPGHPYASPMAYDPRPPQPVADRVPWSSRPIATSVASQHNSFMEPFSFSAGLTRQTFSGDFGIILFDRILVNDGGHYNPQTGIFTVPADGRYLVTGVVTAPRGEHVETVLSVNNRSMQKLDTAGYWTGHSRLARDQCKCGGSASFSLILPLRRGYSVALVRTAGKLAISESREILSSFSAVFLYPPHTKR